MKGNFNTEYGRVVVNDKVIIKIAGYTALDCFGIVGMAALSKRDGIVKLLTRDSLSKGIKVETDGDQVSLEFHVIVSYGVAIAAVAENLISSVKYAVETATGFKLARINIFVDGVIGYMAATSVNLPATIAAAVLPSMVKVFLIKYPPKSL